MSYRDQPISKIIPTYLFDEHNEAFYFWHKARHEGYLDSALDIFHIDAHSDMAAIKSCITPCTGKTCKMMDT